MHKIIDQENGKPIWIGEGLLAQLQCESRPFSKEEFERGLKELIYGKEYIYFGRAEK